MIEITCLACQHTCSSNTDEPLESGIFRCDECGARMAFGVLMPRIVVTPVIVDHRPMLRMAFQDPKTKTEVYATNLDPQLAEMVARDILSVGVNR